MFNYLELENRYKQDSSFNNVVNVFRNLIEKHGFLPDELRQAAFLAQYQYQTNSVEKVIRTQEDWQEIARARKLMRDLMIVNFPNIDLTAVVKPQKHEGGE